MYFVDWWTMYPDKSCQSNRCTTLVYDNPVNWTWKLWVFDWNNKKSISTVVWLDLWNSGINILYQDFIFVSLHLDQSICAPQGPLHCWLLITWIRCSVGLNVGHVSQLISSSALQLLNFLHFFLCFPRKTKSLLSSTEGSLHRGIQQQRL